MDEPRSNKTERPTQRRLEKSREKGQVPRSQELPPALMLGGALLFAKVFGGALLHDAERFVSGSIAAIASPGDDAGNLVEAFRSSLKTGLTLSAPLIGCVVLGSAVGQFAQGGFVFSGEGLTPSASKFNPVTNLRGLFALKRIVTTLRTVIKLTLVCWVVYATVRPEAPAMLALSGHGAGELLSFTSALVGRIVFKFFVLALVLALADYLYQKFEHVRGLKMSTSGGPIVWRPPFSPVRSG